MTTKGTVSAQLACRSAPKISRRRRHALANRPEAVALREEMRGDHEDGHHGEARHDAGHEQPAHRNVGEIAVKHEAEAGRHHRRDHRGGGDDRGGERARIAAANHLRAEHLRLHRGVGVAGARLEAHQRRQQHVGLRERARHVPDQCLGEIEQPRGDAGVIHDHAGEGEHRDRDEREGLRESRRGAAGRIVSGRPR